MALIGGAAGAVVVAAGLAFFFFHPKPKTTETTDATTHATSTVTSGDASTGSTTASQGGTVIADNTPAATPIPATPIPATPIPATPPPGPTRQELLRAAVNTAQELEDKGQYNQSLRAWLSIAKDYADFPVGRNHLETMLAHLHERPSPITLDEFKEMRGMITDAAQLGVLAAMILLADNVRIEEPETAYHWYSVAAEKGSVPAMTQLGLMLSNTTIPGTPDYDKAVIQFKAAAEKGDPPAKMALGDCYLAGKGVERDETKALALFREAADSGDVRAMNRLGDSYVHGVGGKIDLDEAFRLFTKAVDAGNLDALGNLGVLYANGDSPDHKPDPKKAVDLWKRGVDKQNAFCTWLYARSVENGIGVAKNPLLARSLYKQAAEAGDRHAIDWCRKNFVPFLPKSG
jgi:TPR repeat protein